MGGDQGAREASVRIICLLFLSLPTDTAASLMYLALQHDVLILIVTGGPILFAIYFGHCQYRDGVQKRIAIMEKAHHETIEALPTLIST